MCGLLYVEVGPHFMENLPHFVLKIELLLTILFNFEKKGLLQIQPSDGSVFDP